MPNWDPDQYLRYAGERERPFWDLVARIPVDDPHRVVDLGCGPGTATARLLDRWRHAEILGLDSSPAMIEQATARAVPGRLTFELGDVADWAAAPGSVDVILSNATLQWVPGHPDLFGRWLEALAPGGALAFQVPGNWDAPSHTELRRLARSAAWSDRLGAAAERADVHTPAAYFEALASLGAAVDLWETTYFHVLTGDDPVLEWIRGSALRPYLSMLSDDAAAEFGAAYGARLRAAYPPAPDGSTLFPFRRIFAVATRVR